MEENQKSHEPSTNTCFLDRFSVAGRHIKSKELLRSWGCTKPTLRNKNSFPICTYNCKSLLRRTYWPPFQKDIMWRWGCHSLCAKHPEWWSSLQQGEMETWFSCKTRTEVYGNNRVNRCLYAVGLIISRRWYPRIISLPDSFVIHRCTSLVRIQQNLQDRSTLCSQYGQW